MEPADLSLPFVVCKGRKGSKEKKKGVRWNDKEDVQFRLEYEISREWIIREFSDRLPFCATNLTI